MHGRVIPRMRKIVSDRFRFLAADANSAIASGSRAATTAAGRKRRQEQLHLGEIIY